MTVTHELTWHDFANDFVAEVPNNGGLFATITSHPNGGPASRISYYDGDDPSVYVSRMQAKRQVEEIWGNDPRSQALSILAVDLSQGESPYLSVTRSDGTHFTLDLSTLLENNPYDDHWRDTVLLDVVQVTSD